MTAKTSTRKTSTATVAPVMEAEVEYHPTMAYVAAAKVETDKTEAAKRGTWEQAVKAAKVAYAADTRKLTALDKARAALLDTRCEVVRTTAHLMTFPESHAKSGKTAGKPSQSVIAEALGINRLTFAPYFKAATELFAKFPELETNPGTAYSEDEREHVASFWKAEALRAKQNRERAAKKAETANGPVEIIAPGDGEDGETAGAGAGTTDGRTSAITADTAIACMKLLADALDGMRDQKLGFSEAQAEVMQAALAEAQERVFSLTVASK